MSTAKSCPLPKLDRVLLATDRSVFSQGAESEAIDFAKKCSSRLYVISALETNPEYETIGADVYQEEEEEAAKYLEGIKTWALEEGVRFCEAALLHGQEPYRLIVDEAAKNKVDLIIVGRRGRSGIMKMLMGKWLQMSSLMRLARFLSFRGPRGWHAEIY